MTSHTRVRSVRHTLICGLVGLALTLTFAAPSRAQISVIGNSNALYGGQTLLWSDSAYDPVNQVYFVCGGFGDIFGAWVGADGKLLPGTGKFRITNTNTNSPFGLLPRCSYSPDLNGGKGGFLVSWHQTDGNPKINHVHAIAVAYPNGVVSGDLQVSDDSQAGSNTTIAPAISYSTTSKRFMVAWTTVLFGTQFRLLDANLAPLTPVTQLVNANSRDVSVAWNSATDEFGVFYGAWSSNAFVAFRRVRGSDGANVGSISTFGFTSLGTFMTDVKVNPLTKHYLCGWAIPPGSKLVEFDENGNQVGSEKVISANRLGASTSFELSFNQQGGTFLAISEDPNSIFVIASELNGTGTPKSTPAVVTNGATSGSFNPRVSTRSDAKDWLITFGANYTAISTQVIRTSAAEGGPVSNVTTTLESPTNDAIVRPSDTITVSGWSIDRAATSGTGIDAVHVWAQPSSGPAVALGIVSGAGFTARPDISGLFGAQFANSGFSVSTSGLAPGTYTLLAYPHSSVTGNFGAPKSVSITVAT